MSTLSRIFAISAFAMVFAPGLALAQTVEPVSPHQVSHVSNQAVQSPTRVNISADVQEEVIPDTVRLVFAKQITGKDQKAMGETLNKSLNAVLKAAKNHAEFTVSNGDYGFWKTGEKGELWEMRAEVIVTSQNFDKARAFIGEVSEWINLDGISFYLSHAKTQEMENKLLEKVALVFRDKANRVTKAFGAKDYHIDNMRLDVGSGGNRPRPYMAMLKSAPVSASTPNGLDFEGGKIHFNVRAEGQISLTE